MVKFKIIWPHKVKIKLYGILEYYNERNKSNSYSIKLFRKLNAEIRKLENFSELGVKIEMVNVRGLIVKSHVGNYEIDDQKIIVHTI